jgi:hypothetical protein
MPLFKYVELEEAIIRTDNNWANVSVIWIFKKIADIPDKLKQEGGKDDNRKTIE